MSALVDAIRTEVAQREERQGVLTEQLEQIRGELSTLDEQLEQLHAMAEQATNLNGGGPGIAPPPVEPGRSVKANGGRSTTAGRKGGKAPDGRRTAGHRRSGSAPSRSSRPSGDPDTSSEGGGTKRAAVLAFVQKSGRCKLTDIAAGCDLSSGATKRHVQALVTSGQLQAEGATRSRVYFTTENGDREIAEKAKERGRQSVTAQRIAAVKDLIARNPAKLSEERIAYFTGFDRELVADICGRLLEDNEILLHPDATYSVDRGGSPDPWTP